MAFNFHAISTVNGFNLAEVASALQKAVRRAQEEEALHWAIEMADSGFSKYMFKRLKIIAAEDIGLIDPQAFQLTKMAEDAYEQEKKASKSEPDKLYIALAVLYLVRSKKNREVDDFLGTILHQRENGKFPEVPDYAVDGHTQRGKQKKETKLQMWWNSGRVLQNVAGGNKYFDYMWENEGKQHIDGMGDNDWVTDELKRLQAVRK
ncbi:hypothetical protein KC644_01475 [Candidatus Berkelbacteria bacterium]|nr:hypothetical protein [Candidatus Berkelbacteria bacterium]